MICFITDTNFLYKSFLLNQRCNTTSFFILLSKLLSKLLSNFIQGHLLIELPYRKYLDAILILLCFSTYVSILHITQSSCFKCFVSEILLREMQYLQYNNFNKG